MICRSYEWGVNISLQTESEEPEQNERIWNVYASTKRGHKQEENNQRGRAGEYTWKKQAEKSQEKINKIIGELENEVECFCSTTGKAYIQITEGEENHVVIPIDERKLVEQAFRENRKIINEAVISAISLLTILEEYMKQTGSKREIESAPTEFYKDLKLFAMMANIRLQGF